MASIKRYHQAACMGGDCDCPCRLDYRSQGLAEPRKRIEFPTKKAAEKHLAATATKVARGEYISPEKITAFAKAGPEWLREKANRHPATVQGWRVNLNHLAKLDNVRLDRIDVAAVERVRDEPRANLGAKTISAVLTCAAVFKLAQRRGWVANNPAAIAERPGGAAAELTVADKTDESEKGLRAVRPDEVLSAEEIKKLRNHATPGLHRTLFPMVAATGMRPEEVYASKWSDVSLDAARLFVRRSPCWSRGLEEEGRKRPKFYESKTSPGCRRLRHW
jgi:integrase